MEVISFFFDAYWIPGKEFFCTIRMLLGGRCYPHFTDKIKLPWALGRVLSTVSPLHP